MPIGVIIGASSGIGFQVARELSARGYTLVARREHLLRELSSILPAKLFQSGSGHSFSHRGETMSYVAVVFVVGLLIAIHEYGHLLAAKLCGIPVKRFSVGFGPEVLEFKHAETSYRLSWIPLGGYVLPAIEHDDFHALPAYKRITFALGGPMANIIAAFMGLFLLGLAQLNLPVSGATSFAVTQLWTGLQQQIFALSTLVADFHQVSGIVGIVAVGGAQFGSTLVSLLTFSVLINLSLAVMNLLPLPPLDGGRILFCVLEKIYPPMVRAEAPLTVAGWTMVLVLMVYVTVQDVGRILA